MPLWKSGQLTVSLVKAVENTHKLLQKAGFLILWRFLFLAQPSFVCQLYVVKQKYFRQTLHHQSFVPCTSTTNKYNASRLLLSGLHNDTLEAIFGVSAIPLVPYKNENCDSMIYVFGIKDESRFYIRVFHLSISLMKLIQ